MWKCLTCWAVGWGGVLAQPLWWRWAGRSCPASSGSSPSPPPAWSSWTARDQRTTGTAAQVVRMTINSRGIRYTYLFTTLCKSLSIQTHSLWNYYISLPWFSPVISKRHDFSVKQSTLRKSLISPSNVPGEDRSNAIARLFQSVLHVIANSST